MWATIGFGNQPDIQITASLILSHGDVTHNNISLIVGDARDMHQFREYQFDVVYSNSVIEHDGDPTDMQRMARRYDGSVSATSCKLPTTGNLRSEQ